MLPGMALRCSASEAVVSRAVATPLVAAHAVAAKGDGDDQDRYDDQDR
jgi:hypothetical protein